jgi:hypothetical protein
LYSNSVASITAFINQAIAESNQGYINSRVPITLVLHCIVDSSIASVNSFLTMINTFTASASKTKQQIKNKQHVNKLIICLIIFIYIDGNFNTLRKSADIALLFTTDGDSCGIAWLDVTASC